MVGLCWKYKEVHSGGSGGRKYKKPVGGVQVSSGGGKYNPVGGVQVSSGGGQ